MNKINWIKTTIKRTEPHGTQNNNMELGRMSMSSGGASIRFSLTTFKACVASGISVALTTAKLTNVLILNQLEALMIWSKAFVIFVLEI